MQICLDLDFFAFGIVHVEDIFSYFRCLIHRGVLRDPKNLTD